jgi:carbon-monoxide dehydrogenase medium subunit
MGLPQFSYFRPETLSRLESLLVKHQGKAKVLAGGTDLVVQMKAGVLAPAVLVDIGNLAALQGISWQEEKGLTILAGTKIAAIEHSPLIKEKLPALSESVALLGSSQVRAMASLGGNACNASPSAETPPILIALGAEIIVGRAGSERKLPLEAFFLGYRQVDLKPGEYLKAFFIPEQPANAGSAYLCRMLRGAMEIDIVNVGVRLLTGKREKCREARISLGSVSPVPLRARKAESALEGQALNEKAFRLAGEVAAEEASPIDDIRGSAGYRQEMIKVLVKRALQRAALRIKE